MVDGVIGRETEFAAIGSALRRADLAAVVITGDAGVGKSHLLAAAARHAEAGGFVIVSVSGTRALSDIPLAAFASMLPSRLAGDAGDLVQIRRVIQERAAGRPVLLGLDDAHLLDEASAALAHQLASDLTVFVIATIRTGETPPDAISALYKDGIASRLSLDPLRRDDLDGFARATLGSRVSVDLVDALWKRTLGNPLFGRELLLQARETGTIVARSGMFQLAGPFTAPETLSELVDVRLAGLSEQHQRAAALVAVGGPLEIELLELLVDPDALVELEAARVLAADELDDALIVRFVHPVYADATRRRLGRLMARQLLRDLANTLEAMPRKRPEDVLRIATWRLDAGADASTALLMQASRLANRRNDFALAERLGLQAFDLESTLAAATTLAGSFVEQGRHEEARAILLDSRIDRSRSDQRDRFRATMLEATMTFWGFGDRLAAIVILDQLVAEHPEAADLAASLRAAIEAASTHPVEAMASAPIGSAAAHMPFGTYAVLTALTTLGRPESALTAVGELPEFGRGGSRAIAGAGYGFALVESGKVEAALQAGIEHWERAVRSDDVHDRTGWSISNGWAELNFGRLGAAQRWFDEAAEVAPGSAAAIHGYRWARSGSLLTAALVGDLDAARSIRDELASLPAHDATVFAYIEQAGLAWLVAAEQGPDAAVEMLVRLAVVALASNAYAPRLRILMDIARLGQPQTADALLSAGPTVYDGAFLPAVVEAIRSLAGSAPKPITQAAERLHGAGFRVLAAEVAAGAWQRSVDQSDDARTIANYARRAQEMRDMIDAYATPSLTVARPEVSLSRREREIAVLVAEGRSSREVADELIIGVRTVESHLARVYAKLGVRSRIELAEALGLLGVAR